MKVAIVGLGYAGTRFRTAFRNVAREAGTAHRLSFAYVGRHRTTDEIPYYPTVTAMLAGFRPDVVVVSVPEHARAQIFTELAGYTGFVVSEKNLATSRDDLDLVAKSLADVSGFNLDLVERYSEATSYLRAYVRAHQLELVRANFIWGKDRINDHRPTSGVPSEVVHSLDLVPWICGGGHRLEVDTAIGTRSDFSVSGPEVLDSVALTARLGPGAVTGYSSFVHITRKREVDFVFRTPDAELLYASIVFDTPVWDADHLRIWQRRDDGDELIHELRTDGEAGDPELRTVIKLGRLVRDVTRFVEDGTRPEVPFASLADSLSLQRLLNDVEGRARTVGPVAYFPDGRAALAEVDWERLG
ncbi:oxidoreductase [Streptomyces sp. NPDC057743]|uniref:oxidoreductase n=1 Tax=Streptomyces sp. NPDC057743 TaxID=3346236 RepID=UPI0036AABFB0